MAHGGYMTKSEPTLESLRGRARKYGILISESTEGYRVYCADLSDFNTLSSNEVLTLGQLDSYIGGMEQAERVSQEDAQREYPTYGKFV